MGKDLFSKPGQEARTQKPHRPYLYRVKFPDGTEKDCYCPVCLADRDGHYADGRPRYTGGRINVRSKEDAERHEQMKLPPRYTSFAACSCFVGDSYAERMESHLSRPGKVCKLPRWQEIHPNLRTASGLRADVKVVKVYGVQDEEGDEA